MAILSPAPIALALALLAVPLLARASEGDVFSDAEIGSRDRPGPHHSPVFMQQPG